jgi:gamma-glutamylcyclotransferase (GGCT)/AIG2-like uncharacterized protein YtfP
MEHLFAYGTLLCPEIMNEVAGSSPASAPATLRGYCRRAVRGEEYPAILPDPLGSVAGVLYRDLPAAAWERLDRFEGEMYERLPVQVKLQGGSMASASAYVVRPAFLSLLDAGDWDYDEFLRQGKNVFQRRYRGYRFLR